jgi:hypothetical protein
MRQNDSVYPLSMTSDEQVSSFQNFQRTNFKLLLYRYFTYYLSTAHGIRGYRSFQAGRHRQTLSVVAHATGSLKAISSHEFKPLLNLTLEGLQG